MRRKDSAPGVDQVSVAKYAANEKSRLYKLWNRMASGSYFPSPVRRVEIPKGLGRSRPLGIPTVEDRIAQHVVKLVLEPVLEPHFHPDSYGYRPGKSALDAVAKTRQRCWQFDWVVDVDIQNFFDTIDHAMLLKAVKHHTKHRWIHLYIERWLSAPVQYPDGSLAEPLRGTPQGGVISPLLANLFLHYAMDRWVKASHPDIRFERYADDVVFHCRTQSEAERFLADLRQRLADCGLMLHPTKTRIVYCRDSNRSRSDHPNICFDFLGFTFRPRKAINPRKQIFTGFTPAMSAKAMKQIKDDIRDFQLKRCVGMKVEDIAAWLNSRVMGWINYFGRFGKERIHRLADWLDDVLKNWARATLKRCARSYRKSQRYLDQLREQQPHLFAHWHLVRKNWVRRAV